MKVVISVCYGGFGLSDKAKSLYEELSGNEWSFSNDYDYELRADENLVRTVETLGEDASVSLAKLKVVEIPDDVKWTVEEYDGSEWVAEVHRTWQ